MEPVRHHVRRALLAHRAATAGITYSAGKSELTSGQVRSIIAVVRAKLPEGSSTAELAGACGMTPRVFLRAFRGTFAESPRQWLRSVRLEAAVDALRRDVPSLSEVATACGFSDQAHFTRVFKAETGMTPGAFRKAERAAYTDVNSGRSTEQRPTQSVVD
ncbi:helix-turn-helix domain-containing protein [Luteibacter aegosomatissinici]|uniref:helix-turn-helix domain-containing protein n=1 Tax=Luteibacter aegosomatissinici TaxID=2911539 RepID=UPI003CCD81C3